MSPLQLRGEGGLHEVPDRFLLVGLDDTGHEELRGGHRAFGLGGCAVPVDRYAAHVRDPWLSLKQNHFGDVASPLHAHELRDPTSEQVLALGDFFRLHEFGRIAAIMTADTLCEPALPPYQLIARAVLERIARLTARFGCEGVVMIIEESQRGDRLAATYFEGYDLELRSADDRRSLPFIKFRMPRLACEPLLEVSDFVVHTAGAQVRTVHRGVAWDGRRDFEAVFRHVGPELAEFIEITAARISSPAA